MVAKNNATAAPSSVPVTSTPSETNPLSKNLEDQLWYHGLRPRRDILSLLRTPGDWLVRTTDSREVPEIIISIRVEGKKEHQHLSLRFENNKWVLGALRKRQQVPRFDTVVDLVEYYRSHELPGHIVMKTPIHRPKWLIKHAQCRFDMTKICHGASIETVTEEAKQARESMVHEAQLMSYYVHKHVIQLYGVACDHYPVMIVMEYCPGGNLQHHMQINKDKVLVDERLLLMLEASRGMRYLHSKGCVHRDLAARNCLLSEQGFVKISDFGLSKIAEDLKKVEGEEKDKDQSEASMEHIPLRWMAPETLKRPQQWSTRSDVWSFGVLLFEVFNNGEKPWPDDVPKKIATCIRKGKMPEMPPVTPPQVKQMVVKIWNVNPDSRPTIADISLELRSLTKGEYKIKDPSKLTTSRMDAKSRSESVAFDDSDSVRTQNIDDPEKTVQTPSQSCKAR